jgi:thiol-disulfide isomerase/thioredoxin
MKTIKLFFAGLSVLFAFAIGASAQTTLTALDGSKVDIQGQRDKVVILAIGAKWIPLSAKQADFANQLAKRYNGKNVIVYYIVTDSTVRGKNYASDDEIKSFVGDTKLAVRLLRDGDGALTVKKYNLDQLPAFVILDKNGNMVGEAFGGIDPKYDITIPIGREVDKLL